MKLKNYFSTLALCAAVCITALVSCDNGSDTPDVEKDLKLTLDIPEGNVGDTYAVVNITANPESETYYLDAMTKEEYEKLGDKKVIESVVANVTSTDVLTKITSGSQEKKIEGLAPETSYYVYAFALTREGVAGKLVYKKKITTVATHIEFDAEIEVINEYPVGVQVMVTPNNDDVRYYIDAMSKAQFDELGGGEAAIKSYVEERLKMLVSQEGKPIATIVESYCPQGPYDKNLFNLDTDAEQVVVAAEVTSKGEYVKGVYVEAMTTTFEDWKTEVKTFKYFKAEELAPRLKEIADACTDEEEKAYWESNYQNCQQATGYAVLVFDMNVTGEDRSGCYNLIAATHSAYADESEWSTPLLLSNMVFVNTNPLGVVPFNRLAFFPSVWEFSAEDGSKTPAKYTVLSAVVNGSDYRMSDLNRFSTGDITKEGASPASEFTTDLFPWK